MGTANYSQDHPLASSFLKTAEVLQYSYLGVFGLTSRDGLSIFVIACLFYYLLSAWSVRFSRPKPPQLNPGSSFQSRYLTNWRFFCDAASVLNAGYAKVDDTRIVRFLWDRKAHRNQVFQPDMEVHSSRYRSVASSTKIRT